MAAMMNANAQQPRPWTAQAIMREALVRSALQSAHRALDIGLPTGRIVLSCKVSQVQDLIAVYQNLSERCDYPLHLSLTAAGMGSKGVVASTAALSVLLHDRKSTR